MGKNSKPILSVLVDEDKKEKFADLARRNKYSMGWLVNDAIDRMLAADSINIYSDSIGNVERTPKFDPVSISREDIEEMIKNSIGNLDIEEMVKSSIANLAISSIGIDDVEEMIKTSIEVALEPIETEVAESKKPLAELARRLDDHCVNSPDSIAPKTKLQKSPPQSPDNHPTTESKMSWGEFHAMVELDPPPATDKNRANANIALDQAKSMGITGWEFTANKNFVRK
jgi:hypothetical protein